MTLKSPRQIFFELSVRAEVDACRPALECVHILSGNAEYYLKNTFFKYKSLFCFKYNKYLPDNSVKVMANKCSLALSVDCLVIVEISTWNRT